MRLTAAGLNIVRPSVQYVPIGAWELRIGIASKIVETFRGKFARANRTLKTADLHIETGDVCLFLSVLLH
jgi:hypothetical protein